MWVWELVWGSIAVHVTVESKTPWNAWTTMVQGGYESGVLSAVPVLQVHHVTWNHEGRRQKNDSWPVSLRSLTLRDEINQPVEGVVWPSSLRRLAFGACFNRPINCAVWPSSLQQLTFGASLQSAHGRLVSPVFPAKAVFRQRLQPAHRSCEMASIPGTHGVRVRVQPIDSGCGKASLPEAAHAFLRRRSHEGCALACRPAELEPHGFLKVFHLACEVAVVPGTPYDWGYIQLADTERGVATIAKETDDRAHVQPPY